MCYNYGRFLGEAIESCLNQEPGDYELEVLVIDDGSTDNTPDICSKYSERITIIRTENRGTGPTLISTVELATGDFVCTLDADDVFEPSKLRILGCANFFL
jgi:glycosyltransferase involved in cell wall biosynthesis